MVILMKRIILTGGGTAGHVTPNIALLPALKKAGYEVTYIGSYTGIERQLIEEMNIPYYGISSGKLRRYKSLKNLSDPFRVIKGYGESRKLMKKIKPDIVFSKGGFVSVPVVLAAAHKGIPVITHESDMTPGLANKIAMREATKICCNFPETISYLPEGKAVLTGSPIRRELLLGNKLEGLRMCNFTADKPTILVMGGSTGAVKVNEAIKSILQKLLKKYQVVKEKQTPVLTRHQTMYNLNMLAHVSVIYLLCVISSFQELAQTQSVNYWHSKNQIYLFLFQLMPAEATRYSMQNHLKNMVIRR